MYARSLLLFALALLTLTSCSRSRQEVWDDTSSCSRHVNRGFRSLCGKQGNSRAVYNRNEFACPDEVGTSFTLPYEGEEIEYVPYQDEYCGDEIAMADYNTRPPKESPGDPRSQLPGIEAFKDPSTDRTLSRTFRTIYFPYNSNLVKGDENISCIQSIARYMKAHPYTYIFVEGHCDNRGAEAFNLALGSRRANAVRNMLVQEGVNADNVFTISYGKERPAVHGNSEEIWAKNRRAEFKIYER